MAGNRTLRKTSVWSNSDNAHFFSSRDCYNSKLLEGVTTMIRHYDKKNGPIVYRGSNQTYIN